MIVIPMAGMSSRFFKAGYTQPKYMLDANGKTLFEHSVRSFEIYFEIEPFLFIVKELFDTPHFVDQQAKSMGIKNYHIVVLDNDTRGQAETVALGLKKLESSGNSYDGPITIFNIDTIRPGFSLPEISKYCDAYLEVFEGSGSNWSFAKPLKDDSTLVIETAEKKPISNLCSTGLYYFNSKDSYMNAYEEYLAKPQGEWEKGELYIAPLYNVLINNGCEVHFNKIDRGEVVFCGVPEEYLLFIKE